MASRSPVAAFVLVAFLLACQAATSDVTTVTRPANCPSLLSVQTTQLSAVQGTGQRKDEGKKERKVERQIEPTLEETTTLRYALPHILPIIIAFLVLACYCIWYELRFPAKDKDQSKDSKPRIPMWDIMKFIIMYFICFGHVGIQPWFFLPPQTALFPVVANISEGICMTSFSFISGVFGSNITSQSLSSMLCYTVGAALITQVVLKSTAVAHNLIEPGFPTAPTPFLLVPTGLWYLVDLCIWRLTISPFTHIMHKKLGMPAIIPFLSCILFMHVARHWPTKLVTGSWLGSALHVQVIRAQGFDDALYYGNFFALGLLIGPSVSEKVFLDARAMIGAVVLLICAVTLPFYVEVIGNVGHTPAIIYDGPMGITSLATDLKFLALTGGWMLAVLTCIAQLVRLLMKFAPLCTNFIAGCGSRTLYAYVLQWLVLRELGLQQMILSLPTPLAQNVFLSLAALVLNVTLSTRGCEYLFSWWVMPYWILDIGGAVFRKA